METTTMQSCFDCIQRPERMFCDLPEDALIAFDQIKSVRLQPKGTVLFQEGSPPKDVFVLCEGRARLSICAEDHGRLTLRVAGPGEVLGLSASLSDTHYEVTAELIDNARVARVRRKDLLLFLRQHPDACVRVVNMLSHDLHVAYDRVRSVGLGKARRVHQTRPL